MPVVTVQRLIMNSQETTCYRGKGIDLVLAWVSNPALRQTSCVTLEKLLNFSEPASSSVEWVDARIK